MKYRVEQQPTKDIGTIYTGYIDEDEAGFVKGTERYDGVFYIDSSCLREQYRGTKAVRATSEILKGVLKDHDNVMTKVLNTKIDSIKILLSLGFLIIGTVTYSGYTMVELHKTKENA
jgi:hypothetical protein